MTGVALDRVSKRYGALQVLGDISFSFDDGRVYAIVGRSGVGKTTLLRLIAGLEPPSSGRVEHGRPGSMSFCPQGDSLLPWLTAAENVNFPLSLRAQRRVRPSPTAEQLLGQLGLAGFEDYSPTRLSGGMRQRVAIARALVTAPHTLIFDEPFSALDDNSRNLAARTISAHIAGTGAVMIMVTHRVEEVVLMADQLLVVGDSPARVVRVHEINLPRPRTENAEYWSIVTRLREEMSGTVMS